MWRLVEFAVYFRDCTILEGLITNSGCHKKEKHNYSHDLRRVLRKQKLYFSKQKKSLQPPIGIPGPQFVKPWTKPQMYYLTALYRPHM